MLARLIPNPFPEAANENEQIALKMHENVSNSENFSPTAPIGTAGISIFKLERLNFYGGGTKFLIFRACGAKFLPHKFFNMSPPPNEFSDYAPVIILQYKCYTDLKLRKLTCQKFLATLQSI